MFHDISHRSLLYLKAALFVLAGILASAALLIAHPSWKDAALLALAVWSFSRAYYFVFYVITHYIDPNYRYAGLIDFARYLVRQLEPHDRD